MKQLFKFGLAFIKSNQLLLCRPYAFDDLILPGGIAEGNETFQEGLQREVTEELGPAARLDTESLVYLGRFKDRAAGKSERIVEIALYHGRIDGPLVASSEIKELIWFSALDDPCTLSPIIRNHILPCLMMRGLITTQGHPNAECQTK